MIIERASDADVRLVRYSHSRLREDVVVRPCGNARLARAIARAHGAVPRVRNPFFSLFCSLSPCLPAHANNMASLFLPTHRSGGNATGCRHEVTLGERYLDLRQNPVLGGPAHSCLYSPFPYCCLAEDLSLAAQRCYGIPSYWSASPASASTDFVWISV